MTHKVLPLPPNKPQRQDSAVDQYASVCEWTRQYCSATEWETIPTHIRRMYCERLGCYDAADRYFPIGK